MEMKKLGERLKDMRCKANLSQDNVADYLGVQQSLVSMIEKGERNINTEMLQMLSDLYCCPISAILSEEADTDVYEFAFRTKDINTSDLEAFSTISRIALNQIEMEKLAEK